VVLPGQGAMRDCMRELQDSGLQDAVLHAAAGKPLMGVCVGMQMLLDHSEEQDTPGLGLIPGRVRRFRWKAGCSPTAAATRCRRWAGTACARPTPHPMWAGVPDGSWFYFVHSYYAEPERRRAQRRHRLRRALYLRAGAG
jgi:glutamine amidotransferase